MSELENLARAIRALEAQRSDLGDEVVDAALAPLRERLAGLRADQLGEQRRLVSILFADLVDFTPLAAGMDPEDVGELMKAYFQRWSASIRRHGGAVAKFIGDAVLGIFGFPIAHEDDTQRCILAAVDMQRELTELNRDLGQDSGPKLAMRVGINTGEVVVSMLGERGNEELTVVGDAVNLASRIQTAAPEGEILITADTARHVASLFELVPLGPLDLKGIGRPVTANLVRAAKPRTFHRPTYRFGPEETLMVGRQRELELLRSALVESREGDSTKTFTVVGEPGIGKSRLLREFEAWLQQTDDMALFRGRALQATQAVPMSLIRDVFAEHAGIQDSDSPVTVRRRLADDLSATTGSGRLDIRTELIARFLGFEIGVERSGTEVDLDQESLRTMAVQEVAEYFRAAGKRDMTVLLLEDLHWADDASLEVLEVVASAPETSLLIVTSARPEAFDSRIERLDRFLSGTVVELNPLTQSEGEALLTGMLRSPIPEELHEVVLDAADGNPFYIEELTKMLIEDGVLHIDADRWRLREGGLEGVRVPPTLTEVLQARFDTLDVEERKCLQRGSVIGRVFWDKAVDFLATTNDPGDGENLDAASTLAQLGNRDMVFREEPSTFENTEEYSFKHALLRDVTYSTLLKRRRRVFHQMAAHWLEDVTGVAGRQNEFSRLIADHHLEGDAPAKAAKWYLRAGQAAAAQFANRAALDAFGRALELMPDPDPQWRAGVLLQREEVLHLLGEREGQRRDLAELQTIVDLESRPALGANVAFRRARLDFATGDYDATLDRALVAETLAIEAGENPELAARCAVLRAAALTRRGEVDDSALHAQRAIDLISGIDLPKVEADATRQLGLVSYYTGELQEALDRFGRALDLYREAGDKRGEASAINNLGGTSFELGDYGTAADYYLQSFELAQSIGDRLGEARSLNNLGIIAVTRGEYELAEDRYLHALAIGQETGNRHTELSTLDNLGNLALYRYRYTDAERYQLRSVAGAREIGDRLTEGTALGNLGRGYVAIGAYEEARKVTEASLELAETVKDPVGVCTGLVILGQCELGFDGWDQARRFAGEALDRAVGAEFRSERAMALHLDGAAQLGLGRLEEAIDRYRRAFELRSELDEPREALESQAAWAAALAEKGDTPKALSVIEPVLAYLDTQPMEGFENPGDLLLAAHRCLVAADDPRSETVLRRSHDLIESVVSLIEDDERRRSYLSRVPAIRVLIAAWDDQLPSA